MIEVFLVLLVTALASSLLGVFLVLKGQAMTTDAISHTILLGIVIAFFITNDLRSPLLIVGAAVIGLITVYLIELVTSSGMMKQDAAIGIVFTALFAGAVILVSRYADDVHLDIDVVLMGQVLFAPLNRIDILGVSLPYALVQLTVVLIINVLFVLIFYKELKVTSFDPVYAAAAGISTTLIYYLLMTLVSVTAVTAFDAVGSILVISFFVAPAITAYLVTKRLSHMIWLTLITAAFNSLTGCTFGYFTDISISGSVASVSLMTFLAVFFFNKNGWIRKTLKSRRMLREI
jgi:manganese/zinc/iron transport system permease protein